MIARTLIRRGWTKRAAEWVEDSVGGFLLGCLVYALMWLLPIVVELTSGRPL